MSRYIHEAVLLQWLDHYWEIGSNVPASRGELELTVNGHLYSFKLKLQRGLEIISSCFHLKELSFKFTIKVPSSKLSTHLAENGLKFLQI